MKTANAIRPAKVLTLFVIIALFVSLMAMPAAASVCTEGAPDSIALTKGLVITERTERGLGREFIHVVIDGGAVVTMDVPTWQLLTGNDPEHPGYMMYYDSVFTLWQAQRAARWVSRNMYLATDGGLGHSITSPRNPEFRNIHLATASAYRLPLTDVLSRVTGDTVAVVPAGTMTIDVYRANKIIRTATVEVAQITAPVK